MQQASATAWPPASDRKIYIVWIGAVWAAILAGFGMDFARYQGDGFARIWIVGIKTEIPGMFGWWLQYFWGIFLILVAMGVWDLWRRRRIHPAVLFGAALLWTGEVIATVLNFSPTWREMMVRLVDAWGYAG